MSISLSMQINSISAICRAISSDKWRRSMYMAEESKEAAGVCVDGSSRGASERETLAKGEGADGSPKGSSRRRPPPPPLPCPRA